MSPKHPDNSANDDHYEEPEGVDPATGDGWGDYPLDSVFVRTETRTVSEVVKRITDERYILDPDFQRDFVWDSAKQSKLIESCIMRIPLPVFYVAEARDGRIIVVDGLQRLTTFVRFLGNKLKLVGLSNPDNPSGSHLLENKYIDDLPINLQERVLDTQLTMYILDAKAPERARLDIFERVNSGAPLTRQQMRNALYSGPATSLLREAANLPSFLNATGRSLNKKTMRDREAVNRFCAFKILGANTYKTSDMDTFLADGLVAVSKLSESQRDEILADFDHVMNLNLKLFGRHAFRKSLAYNPITSDRSVINISLFEVCSVCMTALDSNRENAVNFFKIELAKMLRNNPDFANSISYSTNSTKAISVRHASVSNLVEKANEQ